MLFLGLAPAIAVTSAGRVANDSERLAAALALALPWLMVARLSIADAGGSVPKGTVTESQRKRKKKKKWDRKVRFRQGCQCERQRWLNNNQRWQRDSYDRRRPLPCTCQADQTNMAQACSQHRHLPTGLGADPEDDGVSAAPGEDPSPPVDDARGVPGCVSAERSSCWIAERTSVRKDEEAPSPGIASPAPELEVPELVSSPVCSAADGGSVTGLSISLSRVCAGRGDSTEHEWERNSEGRQRQSLLELRLRFCALTEHCDNAHALHLHRRTLYD